MMRFAITLTVDAAGHGRTLAQWLCYMLVDETPDSVHAALREGRVELDGVAVKDPDARLVADAQVRFVEAGAD